MKHAALLLAAATAAQGQCDPRWKTVAVTTAGPQSDGAVRAITAYNGDIVVGGNFTAIGQLTVNSLAASSDGGFTWHSLGGGASFSDGSPGYINALLARSEGLYAAGTFEAIGDVPAISIARWDGVAWHPLDQGLVWPFYGGSGQTLFSFNDEVVVSGWFFSIGSTYVSHITRWNGAWDFFDPYATHSHGIQTATPWAGSVVASCVAADSSNMIQWDGTRWNQLPSTWATVNALAEYQGNLYAGSYGAGGVQCVMRLSGDAWTETAPLPVPTGSSGRTVYDLHVHNGELYAGGNFRTSTGAGPDFVARWNNGAWVPVGAGPGAVANCLATIDGDLWAGTLLSVSRFSCDCLPNCDNSTTPPILNAGDFQCFLNQFAAGSSYANCDASTAPPILNANDFQCFLNAFAIGCP